MKTTVIDNFLENDLLDLIEYYCKHEIPHFLKEVSNNEEENRFYSSDFSAKDIISNYFCYKIAKILQKRLVIDRIYANIQWPGMDGQFHKDPNKYTGLLMVCPTNDDGAFQIQNEGKYSYVRNRMVIFDGNKPHRGLSFKKGVRVTIAIKMNEA